MKINKLNQLRIEGTKRMPKVEESFEKQIEKMVSKLTGRAEREVAEYGDFAPVFETLENHNKKFNMTDFVLKIQKPKGTKPDYRAMYASAYNMPNPMKYEHILVDGSKEDILKALKDKNFLSEIKETFERLASHFD